MVVVAVAVASKFKMASSKITSKPHHQGRLLPNITKVPATGIQPGNK